MNNSVSRPPYELKVQAAVKLLPAVLSFVRSAGISFGLSENSASRLELVVEEACMNVIVHAYRPEDNGYYDVKIWREPGKVVVDIEDSGLPFDFFSNIRDKKHGIGTELIETFADEIEFCFLGTKGKRLRLVKKIESANIDDFINAAEDQLVTEDSKASPAAEKIEVRFMREEDAIPLARCIYRVYGYTYIDEDYYYPERIAELVRSGKMDACLAVSETGEIAGHWQISRNSADDRVAESGAAVVDPRYRGHDIFAGLVRVIMERAASKNILGINSKAVTVHPVSQKTLLKIGAKETGFIFGFSPSNVVFKNLKEESENTRRAVCMFYTKVLPEPERAAYLPARHTAFLQNIYEHVGLKRTFPAADPDKTKNGQKINSDLEIKTLIDKSRAFIKAHEIGADFPGRLKDRLKDLCLQKIDIIILDLPISCPSAPAACEYAETLGFFLCGIVPESMKNGDILRLEYLNNVVFKPENIVVVSDFGKEIFSYITKLMN